MDFFQNVSPKNKKNFKSVSKKWEKLYTKFLLDIEKLKTEAGNVNLDILITNQNVYGLLLELKDI